MCALGDGWWGGDFFVLTLLFVVFFLRGVIVLSAMVSCKVDESRLFAATWSCFLLRCFVLFFVCRGVVYCRRWPCCSPWCSVCVFF